MNTAIQDYNDKQVPLEKEVCDLLASTLSKALPNAESKVWHAHPVWFLNDNPIVGYSKLKAGIRLMFWSGASFDEKDLQPGTGKFKDASIIYTNKEEVRLDDLKRWLLKAQQIQWDYKNLIKRKGKLERLF